MKCFLSLFLCAAPLQAQNYHKTLRVDLNRDGKLETLILDAKREKVLTIYQGKTKVWSGLSRVLKPWKMATGDVDGDGKSEIILGVHKSTRFMPFEHNCLFIWGFDGKELNKIWLGSSLSKPFSDFLVFDIDGDKIAEVIALETKTNGKKCVAVYSWSGFGFGVDWQSGDWKKAKLIRVETNKITVEADGKTVAALKPKIRVPI